ncbi:MAG: adenylate/guanylate cyclase domain-containing protein [Bacteroidota bacterium]
MKLPFRLFLVFICAGSSLLAQVDPAAIRADLDTKPDDFKKIELYLEASAKVARANKTDEAIAFAQDALDLAQKRINRVGVVKSHSQLGLLHVNKKDWTQAREHLGKAIRLKKQLLSTKPQFKGSLAKDYRLLGFVEEQNQHTDAALANYRNTVKYALEGKSRHEAAWGFFGVGQMEISKGNYASAVGALKRSISLADDLGLTRLSRDANRSMNAGLAVLGTQMEKEQIEKEITAFQEEVQVIQDSLETQQQANQVLISERELLEMERQTSEAELKAAEAEIETVNAEKARVEAEKLAQDEVQQKWYAVGIGGGVAALLIIFTLISGNLSRRRHNRALAQEKKKSEDLLFSILPEETALEILQKGKATPHKYHTSSIIFTDFVGFTSIAANLRPEALLAELNHVFAEFDKIMDQYGLEKIKTIGDAYMAVAGVPKKDDKHALHAVAAGLDMQAFMKRWRSQNLAKGKPTWELRVGIHSGPVVAGVIGAKKFAYDVGAVPP